MQRESTASLYIVIRNFFEIDFVVQDGKLTASFFIVIWSFFEIDVVVHDGCSKSIDCTDGFLVCRPFSLHRSFATYNYFVEAEACKTDRSLARCNGHSAFYCGPATNRSRRATSRKLLVSKRRSPYRKKWWADNLSSKFSVFWIVFWRRLVLFADLLRLSCDLLQIFLFTITIQQSARYSPRDQSVFYWVARLEYTFVGILAIWHLLYNCLMLPPPYVAISVLVSMVRMVSTSILFAASILLKVRSNPEREESKVRKICFERLISVGRERNV